MDRHRRNDNVDQQDNWNAGSKLIKSQTFDIPNSPSSDRSEAKSLVSDIETSGDRPAAHKPHIFRQQSIDAQFYDGDTLGDIGDPPDSNSFNREFSDPKPKVLERQKSVEHSGQISSVFSVDSLNPELSESSNSISSNTGVTEDKGLSTPITASLENLLNSDRSEVSENASDTETVKPAASRRIQELTLSNSNSTPSSLDNLNLDFSNLDAINPDFELVPSSSKTELERMETYFQEGFEDVEEDETDSGEYKVSYEPKKEIEYYEENFLFDRHLDLEQIGHVLNMEVLRPERLDTVEELSEPVSTSNSLPHDWNRWPSQNTSLTSTDIGASLTNPEEDTHQNNQSYCSNTSKEEPFSVQEIEVGNPYLRRVSDVSVSSDFGPQSGIFEPPPPDRTQGETKELSLRKVKGSVPGYTLFGEESDPEVRVSGQSVEKIEDSGNKATSGIQISSQAAADSQLGSTAEPADDVVDRAVKSTTETRNYYEFIGSKRETEVVEGNTTTKEEHESYRSTNSSVSSAQTSGASELLTRRERNSKYVKQLAEVKQDIYRLLSEDSDHSLEKDANSIEHIDYTELDSGLRGDEDSSQSIDIDIREKNEKHEWESTEKGMMGCVGREREDKDTGTDSGIERMSSAGTTGWMAKIGNRIRRGRIGSGGQSTASSSPDDRIERPRSASTESPREGGFLPDRTTALLENRVRELWIRLAQMETEKIKAVEQAVEQERVRVDLLVEKERLEMEVERDKMNQRAEEVEMRTKGVVEAQERQVQLVNSLQAKLVKYRAEAEDAQRLVAELGGRSREDVETIASLRGELDASEQKYNTQQILHKSEIQEWKVRLEEEQEKNKTVTELNTSLRQERDELRQTIEVQRSLVINLEAELDRSRDEIERERTSASTRGIHPSSVELEDARRLISSLRRECSDLKVNSIRELGKMKLELVNMSRLTSTACLEVSARSSKVRDSKGREVIVGSLEDVYSKYEKMKEDKENLEDEVERLEREKDELNNKVNNLEKRVDQRAPEPRQMETIQLPDDHMRSVRIGKLEGENMLLRSSLQDIASMVEPGLDKSVPNSPRSRPRIINPSRSVSRRTRSASPAMVESTVAAVQSILNRKQVESHELSARVNSLGEKLAQVTKSEGKWETRCKELDLELASTKSELDKFRKEAFENRDEVNEITKKLNLVRLEKEDNKTSLNQLTEQVEQLEKMRKEFEFSNSRLEKNNKGLKDEKTRLEQRVYELAEQNKEGGLLISQLERVGSSLREETIELRERLAAVERDQERLERERNETETLITEEKQSHTSITSRIVKMEREERILRERIESQENNEAKLKAELAMTDTVITGLREEILEYETKMNLLDGELSDVRQSAVDKDASIEALENDLRDVKVEKAKLENQLTSLNLGKEALEERNKNLVEEIRELKFQEEDSVLTNAALNERKEGLEERLSNKEREIGDLKARLSQVEVELTRELKANEELRTDLEDEEFKAKSLMEEAEEKNSLIQQLNQQVIQLKSQCIEANNHLSKWKDEEESEFESERKKLEKKIRRLEADKESLKDELDQEIELIRKELETKKDKELKDLENRMRMEQLKFEDEIDLCNQVIDNLKTKNKETLIMAENSRNAADRMTESEEMISEERIRELTAQIEDLNNKISHDNKEHILQLEKEKSNASQTNAELKKTKAKLEEAQNLGRQEKDNLRDELLKLKGEKNRADSQFYQLKERLSEFEREAENLKSDLKYAEDRLKEREKDEGRRKKEIEDLEAKLGEKNKIIQEKIKEKHKEVEQLERKLEVVERNETLIKEELKETKEILDIQKTESSSVHQASARLEEKVRELSTELELARSNLAAESSRNKDLHRFNELKKKYDDLLFEKKKLESEQRELKRRSQEDIERYKTQLQSMENDLLQGRERERQLESLRHDLGRQMTSRGQEYNDLVLRLRGAEGRLREMTENSARLEASKEEYESKLAMVNSALHQRSRTSTPTRNRSRFRSGESYRHLDESEIIRGNVSATNRTDRMDRERSDLLAKIEALKRSNEDFARSVSKLEEEKFLLEQKLASSQLQLSKLEKKVLTSDEFLAEREETVQSLKSHSKTFERKLRELTADLDSAKDDLKRADERLRDSEDRSRKYKDDVGKMSENLNESEESLGRLEMFKRQLESENDSLRQALADKDASLKSSQGKVERLRDEVAGLETHCSRLTVQLNNVQGELDTCSRAEREMAMQVETLHQELSAGSREAGGAVKEAEQLKRRNLDLEQELKLAEDRMENLKTLSDVARKRTQETEDKLAEANRRLSEAERMRKDLEEKFARVGSNNGVTSGIKDELNKTRKENQVLQERTREMEKKIKILKTEIKEYRSSNFESEKIVRTQIPLMSGKQVGGKECGEHLVRIRILEQEAERHLRRIRVLEHQIQETERKTQERVEQLLVEKRLEREKDHTRHTQEIKQLEHSLNTRERMYKERISGLESQVHTLRDQINQENRSRRSFIASSQAISADVTDLRRQLDESLEKINSSRLDPGLIEKETSRLQETLGRYDTTRISPARFEAPRVRSSVIRQRTGSLDNLDQVATSTPLRFDTSSIRLQPEFKSYLDPGVSSRTRRSSGLRRNLNSDFDFANITK